MRALNSFLSPFRAQRSSVHQSGGAPLQAPLLIVADGAPGLIGTAEQPWPRSDRQRCTVHCLRNVLSKLRECVRLAYWRALDEATSVDDGKRRLRTPIGELDGAGYAAAAAWLADDLGARS